MIQSTLMIQAAPASPAVQGQGLTLGKILSSIPHNAPAIVGYVLLLGFVYLVWRGSRTNKGV